MTATQTRSAPHPTDPHPQPDPSSNGRSPDGRFAQGNAGGPGNPYYRRQAELKRQMLAHVTDVDVMSVMRVLLGLARTGDLAAIKLFLEYAVGKPSKEVDPDKEELHEWQLQQQTPRLQQVLEVMAHGIETPRANQVARDMVPIVGDCHLKTVSKHIRDGTDAAGHQIAPPMEEPPPEPDPDGGKRPNASARRMAASVRATDQTGDNGAKDWNTVPELELAQAFFAGEIGVEVVERRFRGAGAKPDRPGDPGLE